MTRTPPFWCRLLPAFGLSLLLCGGARAQAEPVEPLGFASLVLSGIRTALTDCWATLELTVVNRDAGGRAARVVVFFASQPDVQYARDVWLPGRSILSTWMLLGPAPAEPGAGLSREVQVLLYDRTGGQERLVLPPGEHRVRFRGFLYRAREPLTCVLLDRSEQSLTAPPQWSPAAEQALRLLYTFRQVAGQLPLHLETIPDRFLPPTAEGFDGVDCFVLAGRRLAEDPAGERALRRWLQQGGTLWVMLDLADPDVVARLLGDSLPFQIVDRTSLTRLQIQSPGLAANEQSPPVELEQPVDVVRVLLTPADKLLHTIDGWPASFTRPFGRGKVLFTTVGAPAWFRERTQFDPPSPSSSFPDLPVPLQPLLELARTFGTSHEAKASSDADVLEPLVTGAVGYSVPEWSLPALIFGGSLLAVVGLGLVLRRCHRFELAGLCGPAAAVGTGVVFVVLGQASRNAVPPTVAVAEIIHVAPTPAEQEADGLLAVYRPDAGLLPAASTEAGLLELDTSGLRGETRRRVLTDTQDWHWENLAVPTGLRLGSFRYNTLPTGASLAAVAQFGPAGVTGRVQAGPFRELGDALLSTPTQRPVAVRLGPEGAFGAGSEDLLPPGQYLPHVVLSDRQQRRVAVYHRLLTRTEAPELDGRSVLLVWAEPPSLPFTLEPGARTVASTLLAIPLQFERPPADTLVTVPSAFVPCQRLVRGKPVQPTLESGAGVDMHLRFQLPPSVLPLKVARARLLAKVRIPQRRFTVAGYDGDKPVELFAAEGPAGALAVDIAREPLLRLDEKGGLHLNLAVGELPENLEAAEKGSTESRWSIESLELEVAGRTLPVQ